MRIGGSYTIPAEQQRAYQLLQDPEILAECLPGCDHLAKIGDNEYEMRMKMVISAVQGLFTGRVRIADQKPDESFRLMVEGSGKVGFIKGDGVLTLVPAAASTEVRYAGEAQVGGVIAGVGQRLLDTTAKFVIRKFFEQFSAIITGREATPTRKL